MTRAEQIAWAAGLFEGEGCVAPLRFASRTSIALIATNADVEVLERFQEIVRCGAIRPVSRHDKPQHHKDVYEWRTAKREDVHEVINLLWRFLSTRRRDRITEVMCEVTPLLSREHCRRGHAFSEHGRRYAGKWHCVECQRQRQRGEL